MILLASIQTARGPLNTEISLDFATSTWSVPPAGARWGGVLFSDRGVFEMKGWGTLWLIDGMGSGKRDSAVILHEPPRSEEDATHLAGKGRVYAPATAGYKDAEVTWRLLRNTAPADLNKVETVWSGPQTPVRIRAREICKGLLPAPGKLSNGKPEPGATGSGCGEFPGRVLRRMPVASPPQRGAFEIMVSTAGKKLSLTSPTTHWESLAKAIDDKYKPARKTWVDFRESVRPSTGDIYVLNKFESPAEFQHVGMIIGAEGSEWLTADGGQGNKWQSGFIKRKFYPSGQIDGEFGSKARVRGWVDLDNLREVLKEYFPKDLQY